MTNSDRAAVIRLILQSLEGCIVNRPEKDADGDEHNVYVLDAEEWRVNLRAMLAE